MARREYNHKSNLSILGTPFNDETHVDCGGAAFYLDHSWFFDDLTSGDVLVIRDAAGGAGNLLIINTDYTITNQDTVLTTDCGKNVYSTVTIINAVYQTGTLYFSGKYVGDSIRAEDLNQTRWQYSAVNASATLAPTSFTTYGCTSGTNGIKLTLPAVSMAYTNIRLEFIKLDDTNSAVTIDGSSAETINGLASICLIEQYQKVTIMCDGTNWIILQGTLIADSGWINTNDWTERHLGTANCPYDGLAGTFQIGELITEETSGNTGIVMVDSGSNLVLWRMTGTGYFTNDKTITGAISGATAKVNTATTTKIIDYNFYHGFVKGIYNLSICGYVSTDKTEANTFQVYPTLYYNQTANTYIGLMANAVDTNYIRFQTGYHGAEYLLDNATYLLLDTEDYYYRFVVKLII